MRSEYDVFEKLPKFHSHLESFSGYFLFECSSHFQNSPDSFMMPEFEDRFSVAGTDTLNEVLSLT